MRPSGRPGQRACSPATTQSRDDNVEGNFAPWTRLLLQLPETKSWDLSFRTRFRFSRRTAPPERSGSQRKSPKQFRNISRMRCLCMGTFFKVSSRGVLEHRGERWQAELV